jgi:hypothetical protein
MLTKSGNGLGKRGLLTQSQTQVFFDEEGKAHNSSLTQNYVEDLPRKIHVDKVETLQ